MLYKIIDFASFDPYTLYSLLQLRSEIFVVEQDCVYQDLDNIDLDSKHLLVFDDDTLVASCRLIRSNVEFSEASIGRVVVKKEYRGRFLGLDMVKKAIDYMFNEMNENVIKIEAQSYAIPFYEKCGFTNLGDEHILDGIKHVWMNIKR